jgi:hypothetical protein
MIKKISLFSLVAIIMIAMPHVSISKNNDSIVFELQQKYQKISKDESEYKVKLLSGLLLEVEKAIEENKKSYNQLWSAACIGGLVGLTIVFIKPVDSKLNFNPVGLAFAAICAYVAKEKIEEFYKDEALNQELKSLKKTIKEDIYLINLK